MGIQINGQTNNINAGIGSLSIEDLREIDIVGVATASNFKTGTSNVHSTGYECTNINATGVITATKFVGPFENTGDFTIDDYIVHAGDTDTKFGFPAANQFSVETNGSERVNIRSDGKIGIATDAGGGLINTRHAGTNQQVFSVRADLGSSNNRSLNLYTPDTDSTETPFRFQTGNGYLFQCDSENVFTISHNRMIGIGSLNPAAPIDIHSTTPQIRLTDSDTGALSQINASSSEGNLYVEVDSNSGITTSQTKPRFGVRLRGKEWFGITHNGTWRLDNGYGSMESGSAGQVLTSGGPNSWARWTDQTDVLDMWKCSADISNSDQTIRYFDLGDWTQLTGNPYANLGFIGAYESQGRFRMPSTGYYEISVIIGWNIYNATCKSCRNSIYTTTDDSTYTPAMTSTVHTGGGQSGTNQSTNTLKLYWKVNNISNDKFRISYESFNSNPYIESDNTYLYIKKLRDL